MMFCYSCCYITALFSPSLSQGNRWRVIWRYCSQRILQWSRRQVGNTHPYIHPSLHPSAHHQILLLFLFLCLHHWCWNAFMFCAVNSGSAFFFTSDTCDSDWRVVYTWALTSDLCVSVNSHCIQQILEAVLHCHQMGVVHRDLKVPVPKMSYHVLLWFLFSTNLSCSDSNHMFVTL